MRRTSLILTALVVLASIAAIRSGAAGRFAVYAPLLLFGPGYLLERWLSLGLPPAARPGVWLALSLALVPLCYLWAYTLGLTITPFALFMALLATAAGILYVQSSKFKVQSSKFNQKPETIIVVIVFLAILGLTVWTRVRQIETLAFPPWVDSVHHALIIRAAAEQGTPPLSLEPYLPIEQLPYHWGYHVTAAVLLNATGLELPALMLWLGQLLSGLAVLALASCAAALWGRPAAGLLAGLVPGVALLFPSFLLSWGRYTLLTGLLLLPALLSVSYLLVRRPSWRLALLAALLLAGLNLVHFVVFCFGLAWCLVVWLAGSGAGQRWRALLALLAGGLLALALTLPWVLVLAQQVRPGQGGSPMNVAGNDVHNRLQEAFYWRYHGLFLSIAMLGALVGLWRRRLVAALLLLWSALVMLLANPVWLGLPYLSFITNLMVLSSLFLPISLLVGGLAELGAALEQRLVRRRWVSLAARSLAGGLLVLLALALAPGRASVVRSDTIIATAQDHAALDWVAASTPPDARFVINTVGWMSQVTRGSDGGWWLLPLTGRQTSTPPVIYNYGGPALVASVNEQTFWLRDARDQGPEAIAGFMRRYGYQYAYAVRGGQPLNSDRLQGSPLFERLYQNERVSIFRLRETQ